MGCRIARSVPMILFGGYFFPRSFRGVETGTGPESEKKRFDRIKKTS